MGAMSLAVLCGTAAAETRTLTFLNTHTNEKSSVTFKRDGVYDQAGLKQINYVLRDWRRNEQVRMDPELLDLVWEVYRDLGASEPIHIICGYRAGATNEMLRSRSRGVAKNSQHVLGKALDFNIPGVDLTKLRYTGMKKQYGGVGIYPGSNFVHMDVGSVRTWPNRLSRDQLLALFPDGRTLHLPADGKPLAGYSLAMAEFKKKHPNRGGASSGDEDEAPTPTAAAPVAVAALDTRPAPAANSAPSLALAGSPEPRASATRVEAADADLRHFAGVTPPSKPVMAAAAPVVASLAGPMAQPRLKPVGDQRIAAPEARLALATGARPSPSAADALAVLAGDADEAPAALGYAPPPSPRAAPDRNGLNRLFGEAPQSVASIGPTDAGKVVLAALPPAQFGPSRRDENRPVGKGDRADRGDRGDPLARLVPPDSNDTSLFVRASLVQLGRDPLVRPGGGEALAPLLTKPRLVVDAGFRPGGFGAFSAFSGPAVTALPTRSFE